MMKSGILLLTLCSVYAINHEKPSPVEQGLRVKRGAVGALHIVTNHAQPIHADVKPENSPASEKAPTEKVTAPEDTVTSYEVKSLRKSLPVAKGLAPSTLELVRSVSRVVTLIVLFVSAVLEFYPTFHRLICTIYNFMHSK